MTYHFAYITFEWNYEHSYKLLQGMQKYIQKNTNIQLTVFNALAKYIDQKVDVSVLEILHLPTLSNYDGIIIQGNRAWPLKDRQSIANKAKALNIPVISINYPLPHTYEIGTDNTCAIHTLMDYLTNEKNVQSTVFIGGHKSSEEAKERKKAYLLYCQLHGINNLGCYGESWDSDDGERTAEEYIHSKHPLPDCFICANDNNARAFIDVLKKHGIRVPEDVFVTGFDNQELAYAYSPRITTIDRNYFQIGYDAVQSLYQLLQNKNLPAKAASRFELIKEESTGEINQERLHLFSERFLHINQELHNFHWIHSHFEPALLACNSLIEFGNVLEEFSSTLGVKEVYCMIDGAYFENFENPSGISHYSKTMHLLSAYGKKGLHSDSLTHFYATYNSSSILPSFIPMENDLYMLCPLTYGSTIIGCTLTRGVPTFDHCGFSGVYLSLIETSLENLRKKIMTSRINRRLDTLYVQDSLTGCYNRFGLEKYGKDAFRKILANQEQAYILFADIDDMKSINDTYGHESGDLAIQFTANKLRKLFQDDAFIMRYGGDEFLVISSIPLCDTDFINTQYTIEASENKHFKLSFSIGEVSIHRNQQLSLEEAVSLADTKMYEIKKEKKHFI